MSKKKEMEIIVGNFLFKYRSFTPVPFIIVVLLFFKPQDFGDKTNLIITICGISFSILGEIIRIMSVGFSYFGTSGRENYLRAENLNTSGIYSVVRNPLYIGNVLMFSGLLAVYLNIYALIIFILFLLIQYHFIIKSEENYLKGIYGDEYDRYCSRIKSICPKFSEYKKPVLYFNFRKVLFKENDSIFNMSFMFVILLAIREQSFSKVHTIIIVLLVLLYVSIKIWKKRKNIDIKDKVRK